MKNLIFLVFLFLIVISVNIFADGKKFVRSYTAYTLKAKELELELLYLNRFDKMTGSYTNYKPRFEIEYGILDRLTASFYFNFEGTNASNNSFNNEPFKLESNSLEIRYRLSELGENLLDPALYFEFELGKSIISYEPKIILSKNYGGVTGVLNITSEFEKDRETNEKVTNFEITGGGIYKITSSIGAGLEFRHIKNYNDTFGNKIAQATFVGPTVNINADEFNLTINLMKQIGGTPDLMNGLELIQNVKYELGAILEVEL